MVWLLGGYMWLFIHRPFEVWPVLGSMQIERGYMLAMIVYWAIAVDKEWTQNRLNLAFLAFGIVMAAAWVFSRHGDLGAPRM